MNSITPYSSSLQNITDAWYAAPPVPERAKKGLDRIGRSNLYAQTEETVIILKTLYETHKNNPEALTEIFKTIQEGLKKPLEWNLNELGKWIAANSSHGKGPSMEFVGAYRPLHYLFSIESGIKRDSLYDMDVIEEPGLTLALQTEADDKKDPSVYVYDDSLTVLGNIDKCALFYIDKTKDEVKFCYDQSNAEINYLIEDIQKYVFHLVKAQDLVALTLTNKCFKKMALDESVNRFNEGKISLLDLRLKSTKAFINFLGEESAKIPSLYFSCVHTPDWQTIDWNLVADSFTNLDFLIIKDNSPTILGLKKKFTSVKSLELRYISKPIIFNRIIQHSPSITKLRYISQPYDGLDYESLINNETPDFSVLKDNDFLKEIRLEGNFQTVTGLDNCTSLEKVSFVKCPNLENIDLLQNLPKLTHLSIHQSEMFSINTKLPELKYVYVNNDYLFKKLDFLKESPKLEELIIRGVRLPSNVLNLGLKIHSLELLAFSNLIMPDIKKCTSLKTLILTSSNWDEEPIDLIELNNCLSLETLSLKDCSIVNLRALWNHPTLKTLYIKNCGSIADSDIAWLKNNGKEVFCDKAIKIPRHHLTD